MKRYFNNFYISFSFHSLYQISSLFKRYKISYSSNQLTRKCYREYNVSQVSFVAAVK